MTTTQTRRAEQLTAGDTYTYGHGPTYTVKNIRVGRNAVIRTTDGQKDVLNSSAEVEVEVPSTDVQVDSLGIVPPRQDWGPGHIRRVHYAHGVTVTYERMPAPSDTNSYSEDQRWYYAVWTEDPEGISSPEVEESGYTRTRTEAAEYARICRDSLASRF